MTAFWSLALLEGDLGRLGGVLKQIGIAWSRFGSVLEPCLTCLQASKSVLDAPWKRLGSVLKRLRSLLKAIWPYTEKVENALMSFCFRAVAALGSAGRPLGASWRRLEDVLAPSWS